MAGEGLAGPHVKFTDTQTLHSCRTRIATKMSHVCRIQMYRRHKSSPTAMILPPKASGATGARPLLLLRQGLRHLLPLDAPTTSPN